MADLASQSAAFAEMAREVPIQSMFKSLGLGIARAQARLDENSIQMTQELAETTVDLLDASGAPVTRSLLELGLVPSFYHFTEAKLEVSVSLTMRLEESLKVGIGLKLGGDFSSSQTQSSQDTTTQTH